MRNPLRVSLAFVAISTFAFVACVGDDPPPTDAQGTSDAATSQSAQPDASLPPKADASSAVDSSVPVDASTDAQVVDAADASQDASGPPTTTCVTQTLLSGAFNHVGCNANAATVTPGGKLALGNYGNSSNFGQPYCPIAYAIGSAQVYEENGATFFRFIVIRKTSTSDPGTPASGTYWVKSNDGSGPIELVEMCDSANKGKSRVGTLGIRNGNDFVLTFANGQESWTKM